jgi:hypothetical protein
MADTNSGGKRRRYDEELKREAVLMLMDSHSTADVTQIDAERDLQKATEVTKKRG